MIRLYLFLDTQMFDNINWERTQQQPETVRFNIDNTKFIISKLDDNDYLSELNWVTHTVALDDVQNFEWRGQDAPAE